MPFGHPVPLRNSPKTTLALWKSLPRAPEQERQTMTMVKAPPRDHQRAAELMRGRSLEA